MCQLIFLFNFFIKNTCIKHVGILILYMFNSNEIEKLYKKEARRTKKKRMHRDIKRKLKKTKWQKK